MSWKHLGERFSTSMAAASISSFPHHENEIAQSCCAFDTPRMANVWMHNGFLQVEGDKMSKSLGNFFTIHELLDGGRDGWPGEALRFNMLRSHYRQPIDFGLQSLEESAQGAWDFYGLLEGVEADGANRILRSWRRLPTISTRRLPIAALFELRHRGELQALARSLRFFGFSMKREKIVRNARTAPEADAGPAIDALIAARTKARAERNFAESDRLRDELVALGVVVKDNKDGTTTVRRRAMGRAPELSSSLRGGLGGGGACASLVRGGADTRALTLRARGRGQGRASENSHEGPPHARAASLSPDDAAVLAEIFRASVEELTGEDYTEAQQEAWASRADDEGLRAAVCRKTSTLVATMDGSPLGFVGLKDNTHIDLFFVHPDGRGARRRVDAVRCDRETRAARAAPATHRRCERHGRGLLPEARISTAAPEHR